MPMLQLIRRKRSKAVKDWMKAEAAEQKKRYDQIVEDMEALTPKRDRWIDQFLQRIQTTGMNVHKDQKEVIPANRIPKKPRRKFKVVF